MQAVTPFEEVKEVFLPPYYHGDATLSTKGASNSQLNTFGDAQASIKQLQPKRPRKSSQKQKHKQQKNTIAVDFESYMRQVEPIQTLGSSEKNTTCEPNGS